MFHKLPNEETMLYCMCKIHTWDKSVEEIMSRAMEIVHTVKQFAEVAEQVNAVAPAANSKAELRDILTQLQAEHMMQHDR